MLSEQQVYNIVRDGLAAQGWEQSVLNHESAVCCYRGARGRKCAVGHLIPDALYHENLEGMSIVSLLRAIPELAKLKPYIALLGDLQIAHDANHTRSRMRNAVEAVAHTYNLQP